jgi:hypothetical protein
MSDVDQNPFSSPGEVKEEVIAVGNVLRIVCSWRRFLLELAFGGGQSITRPAGLSLIDSRQSSDWRCWAAPCQRFTLLHLQS